jgi:hypothetical protein
MSYQERLNSFNNSVSQASDHVAQLKETLTNTEMRENPVKMGLNLASQTLGTTAGIARIRQHMLDGGENRAVLKANYNKFGQIKDAINNLPQNLNSATSENIGKIQGSVSSTIADTGAAPSQVAQRISQGTTNPAQVKPNITPQIDRDVSDNISSLGGNSNPTLAANTLNRQIDSKLNSSLSADEKGTLNDIINKSGSGSQQSDLASVAANLPEGPAKVSAHQNFLNFKNNIANDAIARKQQGLPSAQGYDNIGNPISAPANAGTSNIGTNIADTTGSLDSSGIASTGSNAARNALADGGGSAPSLPNPTNVGGNVNAPNLTSTATNAQGDITNVAQAASNDTTQGANIIQRGQQLGLLKARQTMQSGQGNVNGLASSVTSNNPSAQAHLVSQAQQGNADAHVTGSSATNQSGLNTSAQSSGTNAPDSGSNPSATSGSATADDVSSGTNNGLKSALATEETLDEVAPEVPAVGTILEAGSLLATLGTGVASLFEKDTPQKKTVPAADPNATGLQVSVGNLKNSASNAVGAF